MSTATFSFQSPQPPPLPLHRFTVEEYHRLGESGVLSPDDRVELLEGWIVEKMNQKPVHGYVVRELDDWLQSHVPTGWIVQCQLPITLARSEPEPDLAVVRGTNTDYRHRHPNGADCRLVIEVADTSLARDRAKAAIYAAAGIEEYWIINLIDKNLECLKQPDMVSGYLDSVILSANDAVKLQAGETMLRLSLNQLLDE